MSKYLDKYIGTKKVEATLMCKGDYNNLRGWVTPANENEGEVGYLVMYPDSVPNHPDFSGYISWSPKNVFEESYSKYDNLDFGKALLLLKEGKRLARAGWNGKGLTLSLKLPEEGVNDMTLPYIYMTYPSTPASDTAPENHINARVPWLASQTDVLAEDWMVCND